LNANSTEFVPGQFSFSSQQLNWEDEVEDCETTEKTNTRDSKHEPSVTSVPKQVGKNVAKKVVTEKIILDDTDETDETDEGTALIGFESKKEKKKKRLELEDEAELIAKDDPREHLNIVFIGHVDAGKSTISGQILLLTGMVDQRLIEKYTNLAVEKNRESWYLAYLLDTNDEERLKGITVEVGRAHFSTEKKRYTILDAPGHRNFVPAMITGVVQADIAVLVVSSRKGEFESGFDRGQTIEHAILAKTLGVKKLIVAINKMDDPTTDWSKERYDFIQVKVEKYLKSIGFRNQDVFFLPLSGFIGHNIKVPVSPDICPWWNGKTLLETLDSLQPLERMDELPLRIPVLDRYKESGKTIIMGKIETGVLRVGDELVCNPNNIKIIATQIQNDEFIISVAKPGENVRIITKVSSTEEEFVVKGCVISHQLNPSIVTTEIVAHIFVLQLLETKKIISAAYQCVMHVGTSVEEVTITSLLDQLDKTGKYSIKKNPPFVKDKDNVIAHLTLAKPVCVEKYENFAQLGRFTLRDEGITIGFGKILATHAPVAVKKRPKIDK